MRSSARLLLCQRPPTSPRTQRRSRSSRLSLTPLRWRILRLCLDRARTNQQLAERLEVAPATTLRHVRVLVETGFLVAESVRAGPKGALERPYWATRRTWRIGLVDVEGGEGLAQQVDLAMLEAHRAELVDAGSDAGRDVSRGVLRLGPDSPADLIARLAELIAEFAERAEPDGEALSYVWSLAGRPLETDRAE